MYVCMVRVSDVHLSCNIVYLCAEAAFVAGRQRLDRKQEKSTCGCCGSEIGHLIDASRLLLHVR